MPLDPFLQQSQESVQSAQGALSAGQAVFGGRFVLERHLGQGGMGQVWLAQDTTLDQPRALKFVLPALLSDAPARKRLRNEARLGTELAHPRIVRVFDFVEETGGSPLAAVVMEFVEGRTLSDLLAEKENGFFEPEEIESWTKDVVEGLGYAHEEKQRFHLDLKPGNIIIETTTGRAKLLDFGISRSAKDTITRLTGQVSSGTLPYMSPQQLDGEPPCAADDIYGLGATVYELLTGTPPFFRGKLEDQIRGKEPESIVSRRRQNAKEGLNAAAGHEVPERWSAAVAAMLRKPRDERPESVKSVFEPSQPPAAGTRVGPPIPRNGDAGKTPGALPFVASANLSDMFGPKVSLCSRSTRLWMAGLIGVVVWLSFGIEVKSSSFDESWGMGAAWFLIAGIGWFCILSLANLCFNWEGKWRVCGPSLILATAVASGVAFQVLEGSTPVIGGIIVFAGAGGLGAGLLLWLLHRLLHRKAAG